MTRSWWQRNRLGFVGIVAAAAGFVLFWYFLTWTPAQASVPSQPVPVAEGEAGQLGDTELSNIRSLFSTPEEDELFGVPGGAQLLAVAIDVTVTGERTPSCDIMLTEQTGRHRTWRSAASRLTWSLAEPGVCLTAPEDETYAILVPFLLPPDAEGPFTLEVRSLDLTPKYLEFAFTPNEGSAD